MIAHFFFCKRLDAVFGDHPGRVAVIGPGAEVPRVVHMGELRVGAADDHRLANL